MGDLGPKGVDILSLPLSRRRSPGDPEPAVCYEEVLVDTIVMRIECLSTSSQCPRRPRDVLRRKFPSTVIVRQSLPFEVLRRFGELFYTIFRGKPFLVLRVKCLESVTKTTVTTIIYEIKTSQNLNIFSIFLSCLKGKECPQDVTEGRPRPNVIRSPSQNQTEGKKTPLTDRVFDSIPLRRRKDKHFYWN